MGREQLPGRTSRPVCGPCETGWRRETWQERPQGDIQPCARHVQSPKQCLRTVQDDEVARHVWPLCYPLSPQPVHRADVLSVHWAPCDNTLRWPQPFPGAPMTLLSGGFHQGGPLAGGGSTSHTQAHTQVHTHSSSHTYPPAHVHMEIHTRVRTHSHSHSHQRPGQNEVRVQGTGSKSVGGQERGHCAP